MACILVATDFSARSDRALRRATILSRSLRAAITLLHVVDPDRPPSLVMTERNAADALLAAMCRTLKDLDGVDAQALQTEGEAFDGILRGAQRAGADLIVLGAHRRRVLQDVFVGTTAERTIRNSRLPLLMANAPPAEVYRRIAIAVDCSAVSAAAVRAVFALGLDRGASVSLIHVFDALAADLRLRAPAAGAADAAYVDAERARAQRELDAFVDSHGLPPLPTEVRLNQGAAGETLRAIARELSADLLVVGTHGRRGVSAQFLGSVAEAVLRTAQIDVLAVPPPQRG